MWFFSSPSIVFGDDALDYIQELEGKHAFIVTDPVLERLGYAARVARQFEEAGMRVTLFAQVEPEPSLQTVRQGAARMLEHEPDWVVGLGGGSSIDAAKAMYALYERPDLSPDEIIPIIPLGLGQKARLIAIPTTSGTGSECTWMIVLSDLQAKRKLTMGSREIIPTYSFVDPSLVMDMPAQLAADTGIDAIAQAIESYTSTWRNVFADGLCLQAARMVFRYLARSVKGGKEDAEARSQMHLAASIAGLGMSNSQASLSHVLGHALGTLFKIPHGRTIGLYLPYTMEFSLPVSAERYADMARFCGLPADTVEQGARSLIQSMRDLLHELGQPTSVAQLGIEHNTYQAAIPYMVEHGEGDASASSPRVPTTAEHARLFEYAYDGRPVDF